MKRAFLFVGIVSVISATVVFGIDTAIRGWNVMQAKAAIDKAEGAERRRLIGQYHACIKEKYPTLDYGTFGGYVDNRTGTRYNVSGTEQDIVCQRRIYNR